jgi:hypothetical protein
MKKLIYACICLIAMVLMPSAVWSQCQQYNLSISYDKQFMHKTSELFHNNQFSYIGIWYTDSIAVNKKKYTQNKAPDYKCLIIKLDKLGNVVAQIDLILPMPFTYPNLRLDPGTGGLAYVITTYNNIYKINDTLTVNASNKSVLGVVKIDSNLSKVAFVKIAESLLNERLFQGENDIYCFNQGASLMIAVNKAMHLNNGDTIKPKSYCEIYSVGVNNDFQVIGKSLLATTNAGISNYGILNTASGMHYVFKFTKSVTIPSLNKIHEATLNKLLPGAGVDGSDILIIRESNGVIVSSYTIGCSSSVLPIGMKNVIFYSKDRFYFPHNNRGQNLYDNNMRAIVNSKPGLNCLAIFDTAFNLISVTAFEDKSVKPRLGIGFFQSSAEEFFLTANTDSPFVFKNYTYTPQKNFNPTYMNVIFSVSGDSISYKWSQNTENYQCFYSDFTQNSSSFNVYPYPNKTISTVANMTLEDPLYSKYFWMVKQCNPELKSHRIEKVPCYSFPNPVRENILKIIAPNMIQKIVFSTVQGQVIFEKSISNESAVLDLGGFPSGNYLAYIHFADQVEIHKIIKLY